ncbi:MAG: nitronate monooxygenase, partial [Leptospiraceae bacterium]|nr:nitronate monooxygenase [Leptospiraceae bacterium]
MRIPTRISEMLGIDLPILGAPMFLVSYPDLVVAVSEAGGIGCFPALNYRSVEQLRDGLQEIRYRTKKPIGV